MFNQIFCIGFIVAQCWLMKFNCPQDDNEEPGSSGTPTPVFDLDANQGITDIFISGRLASTGSTVSIPGTGYSESEICTLSVASPGVFATIEILTVGGSGEILTFRVIEHGSGYAFDELAQVVGGNNDAEIQLWTEDKFAIEFWADIISSNTGEFSGNEKIAYVEQNVFGVSGDLPGVNFSEQSYLRFETPIFALAPLTNLTIFAVVRADTDTWGNVEGTIISSQSNVANGDYTIGLHSKSFSQLYLFGAFGNKLFVAERNANDLFLYSQPEYRIIAGRWNSGVMTFWSNGLQKSSNTYNAALLSATAQNGRWAVGGDADFQRYYAAMCLGRLQIYQSALSDSDMQTVFTSLNSVYAIY